MSLQGDKPDALGVSASSRPADDAAQAERLRSVAAGFIKTMGVAQLMRQDHVAAVWARIYSRMKAKTDEQKQDVREALVYCFIVYGTSPEVDWTDVELLTSFAKAKMGHIVEVDVGKVNTRKFAGTQGALATAMVKASPDLRQVLSERAIRSGLPMGSELLAVDFIGRDGSLDASQVAFRVRSKGYAVQRGETRHLNHPQRQADEVANVSASRGNAYSGSDDIGI